MRPIGKVSVVLATLSLVTAGASHSMAQTIEVIVNGGLEDSAGPAGWTLTQSITGEPGVFINATEHVDLANEPEILPGELGLFIKPYAGNVGAFEEQNKMVNVSLSQTTFGIAGRTYTLTGHSFFQAAASNIIDTLFEDSPSGAVPSPTESYFEMAFLNSSGAVIGTPVTFDLRSDPTTEEWRMHTLMGAAPTGTASVRVTAAATDMVASCTTACPAGQDVHIDNFSLRDNVVSGLERLTNADLNTLGAPAGWEIEKTPEDNLSFSGNPTFAAHTGSVGMWLRSFAGGDAKILQTVPGTPGEDYTFSAWSKWEEGYNGADPFSSTETFMTMEFLDASEDVIGTPVMLDLRTVQINDAVWRQFALPTTTAPAGTASVRVSAGATDMANSGFNPQSAFFDDLSLLTTAVVGLPGDHNGDGIVDAADYVLWRKTGINGQQGYDDWRANFGAGSGSGSNSALSAAAVPEPGSALLLGIALGMMGLRRRPHRCLAGAN